ncbi:MAG: hypothetical protein ACXWFQ_05230 [Thermoanaerobaculia bacterium]
MSAVPQRLMMLYGHLESCLNKHISEFCGNGYKDDSNNHCAHFVSHSRGYTFGYTCKAAGNGKGDAACLRVHEVFARCGDVGLFSDRLSSVTDCLAFVTRSSAVDLGAQTMANIPKKHIGIYNLGSIYHYSNSRHFVIKESPEDFSHHYPGTGFEVYYGTFPP